MVKKSSNLLFVQSKDYVSIYYYRFIYFLLR